MTVSRVDESSRTDVGAPFTAYADIYDLFQVGKDYDAEVAFVDRLVRRHGTRLASPMRLLDLACGTGRHASGFVDLGYVVLASDISPAMVTVARRRAAASGKTIAFHEESFATCVNLKGPFDIVVAMFASVNYLVTIEAFMGMLKNVRSLLASGGLFVFDCWNGLAVVRDFESSRVSRALLGEHEIVRESCTTVDVMRQRADVEFTFYRTGDGQPVRLFSEKHHLRFFYVQEMIDLLYMAGFEVLESCPFMKDGELPGAGDWNVSFVIRAKS